MIREIFDRITEVPLPNDLEIRGLDAEPALSLPARVTCQAAGEAVTWTIVHTYHGAHTVHPCVVTPSML